MFGDEAEEECTHCQGKHGIFEAGDDRDSRCVFLPGAYNGTYGCCLYSSGATRCTIRADKKEEEAEAGTLRARLSCVTASLITFRPFHAHENRQQTQGRRSSRVLPERRTPQEDEQEQIRPRVS